MPAYAGMTKRQKGHHSRESGNPSFRIIRIWITEKVMDWRALCGEKLVTPEQALELIQPTDRVFIAGLQSTPFTLCRALIEKRAELRGLHLNTLVSLFPWDVPGVNEYFHLESWYLSRRERPL